MKISMLSVSSHGPPPLGPKPSFVSKDPWSHINLLSAAMNPFPPGGPELLIRTFLQFSSLLEGGSRRRCNPWHYSELWEGQFSLVGQLILVCRSVNVSPPGRSCETLRMMFKSDSFSDCLVSKSRRKKRKTKLRSTELRPYFNVWCVHSKAVLREEVSNRHFLLQNGKTKRQNKKPQHHEETSKWSVLEPRQLDESAGSDFTHQSPTFGLEAIVADE